MVKSGKDLEFPPVKEYNGQIFLSINASCKVTFCSNVLTNCNTKP